MNEEVQRHFEQAAECVEDARVLLDNDRQAAAQLRTRAIDFVDACGKLVDT